MSERMLDLLRDLPAALGDLGHGDPDEPGRVLAADVVRWAAEEIARLREERRWVPVGERLPDGEEWVDVAGLWGDSVGWHEPAGWRNVDDDPCPGEVTHWRKRGPGPEAKG